MRKLAIISICFILAMVISCSIADSNSENIVITYGETTNSNQDYKNFVNDYFMKKGYSNLENANIEIISAGQVNQVSAGISGKTYNSNQIFSSALVDLNHAENLNVTVDTSKVNLVSAKMYASALESAGITKGQVYVTSPVSSTGESALAGIMNCYEKATNTEIPEEVKQAANEEIYVESEVVNNSNASTNQISELVDEVKEEVENNNTTDLQSITDTVNKTVQENNIPISQEDIEKIAEAIFNTFNVQDQANNYKQQLESFLNNV